MRNLSIAGKITVFKTLTISKIVHLALVKVIPISTILELDKIKKHFIWKSGNPDIKQEAHYKNHENGDLKSVGITFKIISLQCSWIKQLYDSSTHDWKLIPLHIITQKLGEQLLFHSNLHINPKKFRQFLKFIWHNKHIFVDKRSFFTTTLADKGINQKHSLSKNSHFYWIQLNNAIQKLGKKIFTKETKIFMTSPLEGTILKKTRFSL